MPDTDSSLPYYFPKWMDRAGIRYLNPWMRRIAPALPGFAVVEHAGRKSGKQYETPVAIFSNGRVAAVVLLHGETDWARNVVTAGQATIRYRRGTVTVRNPRIISPRQAGSDVPRLARLGNRIAGVIVFDID
ncbi:nitroreductase family deazaflavin-dependent oxidoreductase [Nocardia sp. NPDC019395]|uniref:nitroreductase family deazaflavin-dependent oxidoreductase n=1 Tax=Nocardia sp. NPDC019395 TaxID=3154686 RepID=UPI0034058A42